jgi:predicted alpha-1,2-mannosidase
VESESAALWSWQTASPALSRARPSHDITVGCVTGTADDATTATSSAHFFSSFEAGEQQPGTGDRLRVHVGTGPRYSPTAKPGTGFSGRRALHYATSEPGAARTGLFQVDVPVGAHTELSYVVLPESDGAPPSYRATHVAVDLEFDDGSTLSGRGATDSHGNGMAAAEQGAAKTLYVDQWNHVRCDVAAVAAGRRVTAIVLTTDLPTEGEVTGWLDDLRLGERAAATAHEAVDHVRTTRGTHSSGQFSRGNTIPAAAVPNGFNFWTPVTDASALDWPYSYHRHNNRDNRPALQAFAASHQPSPWMGDRHTFQIMPGTGRVVTGRQQRALSFSHAAETDRPHHYGVRFDNGVVTDIAPTDHAAVFRFTFPGAGGWVLFDNVGNRGGLRVDTRTGTVTGHTWTRSRSSVGARRMFVYATFDHPATSGGRTHRPPWRTVTGHLAFDTPVVTMRIATSLISLDQARRNLDQEIPAGTTFEQVRGRARQAWQDVLGRIDIEGASEDQRTTFYSNLYRMYLYPNSGHEDTPRGQRHASPVRRRRWPSTRTRTGAAVVDGPMTVNNGFWDTYRTTWPAYALLTPSRCGELIEGFVQQYREGGWISRWSSPGYANLMTGTSSDVAFADAYLKGVRGFDVRRAYEAALTNATVTPPHAAVGRRGLAESIFLGYTPLSTPEGLSWALEGCVNDFGLANLAEALGEHDVAGYLRDRALRYVHHFDRRVGFFQGRDSAGRWRHEPQDYDPRAWGGDYTETDGWNTAFSVPHDGPGLARLHGGRSALAAALDAFFATPETGRETGHYGGVIHEMTEARDVRMGQYAHSNQPSHHIPYLYNVAGQPWKTQEKVREILSRLYVGSDIGQGYPGDEDNGEMSAWYVLSALGFYPLAVGSPFYEIGSPLFTKATVHLENGRDLVISAPNTDPRNIYVHGVKVNGTSHHSTTLPHDLVANGGTLEFDMGPQPSDWGAPEQEAQADPPSRPLPLRDLTGTAECSDGTPAAALLDDTTRTQVRFRSAVPTITFTVDGSLRRLRYYTLTSGGAPGDPRSWRLEGSDDGTTWTLLDERRDQTFRRRRHTRPFAVATAAAHRYYRLRVTKGSRRRFGLAQWELLAEDGERQ